MVRFCAAIAREDPAREVERMGARVLHVDRRCALGAIVEPPSAEHKALFSYSDRTGIHDAQTRFLVGVGDVTVYNRRELVAMLCEHVSLRPDASDGDLLLAIYGTLGAPALAQVRGMFSLGIWDGATLALVTDSIGSRSVFFTSAEGCVTASSSLRALRRWPRLQPQVDLSAVAMFLSCAYLPGERTLLNGVSRLGPAHLMRFCPDGSTETSCYWIPEEGPWNSADPPEAHAATLRDLLEKAAVACLPDGQEVGVFLSGGVDSSLVAALASRLHDRIVRTYTVNFGVNRRNELAHAGLVAKHCGTHHRVLTFNGRQIAARFAETVSRMDCPVGEGLTVPNLLLAEAAAEDGLGVILNGEGGDPNFGGPKNLPMLAFELHRADPDPHARARAYLQAHRHCYDDLQRLLTPEALETLRGAPPIESVVAPYLESDRFRYYLNRLMFTNLRLKGPGYMLAKVEFLTAAAGVQGRYPLFDRDVVAYSYRIPPAFKLAGTAEKWILKLAIQDLLPRSILDRPKSGMRMPLRHWLDGPISRLADRLLLDARGRSRGIFRSDTVASWLRGEGLLWQDHARRLWLLLTLEAWLRAFVDCREASDFTID